ncbi:cation:proton antiporter [Lysinimonas soli]|uniref:Cation:proton antiporter n=1 Tax=Lysinimonas soli TaxID=1074233 RepID=A0ABW0NT35_9MICO
MDYSLVAVGGVVVVVAAAAFSKRLGIAAPLLLVVIGIGYSYIPGVPQIHVDPHVILAGVLPPLLYGAAVNVPLVDFRRNFGSITGLSVLLVLVSALVTGFVLFVILERLDLGAAIALGAVISPTDVVAATAIGKRLGLPPRLLSILEGEGLVNDATALVLLKSAVAAIGLTASSGFSPWGSVGSFAYSVVVALVVGIVVGFVTVLIRRRLNDPVLDTAISFAVPFIAFLPAEELKASGVIAVVAAGLYSGHYGPRFLSPQSRFSERFNWRTIQFVLENGVFLLMGAQLAGIVADVHVEELSADKAVYLGLLLAAILIVLRFVFVWPLLAVVRQGEARQELRVSQLTLLVDRLQGAAMGTARWARQVARGRASGGPGGASDAPGRRSQERAEKRRAGFVRQVERRRNDVAQLKSEGLSWRGGVVLGWAGMRGVVTLAAAQSLPTSTPYYEQLVLIAFTVAIVTLLLQGGTLPLVIRLVKIRGADRVADRHELATLLDEMSAAGLEVLESPDFELPGGGSVDPEIVERVRNDTLLATQSAWERAEHADADDGILKSPHQQYRALRHEVLAAERAVLLDARSRGAYASRIMERAQSLLDQEESRLEQLDSGGRTE